MYLWSLLHGHGRRSPGGGIPTECRQGRSSPSPRRSSGCTPHTRHDAHAHGHIRRVGDLHADMRDGGADRPHGEGQHVHGAAPHAPCEQARSRAFISDGSIQLLVGPASAGWTLQMNVRSSTRATSEGSERARKLPGRFSGLSGISVPASTSSSHSRRYSSSEPSHQTTRSGRVRRAVSITHSRRRWLRT